MYYKCHKVNFKRGGSYIDLPDWIKKKKVTINPKYEDDKCFQWAAAVALNYQEIKWNPERVSSIIPFINKYNWEGINYPSKIGDWKTFIFCVLKKKKYFQLISKQNATREKQIMLLMIPNEEKEGWHYLAVKKLSTLLRGITSIHHGDFYCLNCLHSFRTENLNLVKKYVKIKIFVELYCHQKRIIY